MVSWLKPELVIKEEVLMRVSTNLNSMTAQRYVRSHTEETALEDSKLSSGNRIVSSYVDPAGLAISEVMRSKIRSNYQAERNSNDSISLMQVAEGSGEGKVPAFNPESFEFSGVLINRLGEKIKIN